MSVISRFLPKSLAGQLICLLLLALLAGHATAFVIFSDERREAVKATTRGQVLIRTSGVIRLLEATPADLHQRVVDSASTAFLQFSLSARPATEATPVNHREKTLAARLARQLGPLAQDIRVRSTGQQPMGTWRDMHGDDDMEQHHDAMGRSRNLDLQLAVKIQTGQWLNVNTEIGAFRPAWTRQSLLALLVTVVVVIGAIVLVVRRITRPLHNLTIAADGLGRGEKMQDLEAEGPDDMRRTIDAFNHMRRRLERYINDRTNMLAAVSHDLKTPITSLRIRAEFIEDEVLKEKIIHTLDDMQLITESTLNFAREDAAREENQATDLGDLLTGLCADFQDQGHQVEFAPPDSVVLSCRPASLKRALNNVLDNATSYGVRAQLALTFDPQSDLITITVDDDGPGIPDGELERVFEPFVRVETSRNRQTGGSGLGLAITRSIIHGHGGEIVLANLAEGGLRVSIQLPGNLRRG